MKVSIIIPVYKVEPYIEDCLQSVYNQTFKNIEIILINDNTPDNSFHIAKDFVNKKGKLGRIEVKFLEHNINKGLSASRNTGIAAATGDYIFFLDSDDELSPDCISLLTAPLTRKQYDFVIGEFKVIGSNKHYPSLHLDEGEIIGNNNIYHQYCFKQFYMMACGKLCNLQFIKNNHLLFEEGIIHEDDLWSYQFASKANSMYVVRKPCYIYKIRSGSITEGETIREKMNSHIIVLNLINNSIKQAKRISQDDTQEFLNHLYERRYIITIDNNWKEEYLQFRKTDMRKFSFIFKNCLNSMKYFKANFHRLLPPIVGFYLYKNIRKII